MPYRYCTAPNLLFNMTFSCFVFTWGFMKETGMKKIKAQLVTENQVKSIGFLCGKLGTTR